MKLIWMQTRLQKLYGQHITHQIGIEYEVDIITC